MPSQYIKLAIVITALLMLGSSTLAKQGPQTFDRAKEPTPSGAAAATDGFDWFETILQLLDYACHVLVCDASIAPTELTLESKMERWSQLYRARGVRKGMSVAERQRAAAILHDLTVAVVSAGDEIDPDLSGRFLFTLDEAGKAIASEIEAALTQGEGEPT